MLNSSYVSVMPYYEQAAMTDVRKNKSAKAASAKSATSRPSCRIHAGDIEAIFRSIDKSKAEEYMQNTKNPYVVCTRVSDVEWKKFVDSYDDEIGPIKLCHLEFHRGCVLIVEIPSVEHEFTVAAFEIQFVFALGTNEFVLSGSVKVHHLEPDTSFGPTSDQDDPAYPTIPVPVGLRGCDWLTFVLEVAYIQKRASLERKLGAWAKVPGVKYLLGLIVTENLNTYSYTLYHVDDGWTSTHADPLPAIVAERQEIISRDNRLPQIITMCTRELLGIRADDALPNNVNPFVTIDLQQTVNLALKK